MNDFRKQFGNAGVLVTAYHSIFDLFQEVVLQVFSLLGSRGVHEQYSCSSFEYERHVVALSWLENLCRFRM